MYQTIKKPNTKKKKPIDLNFFSGIWSITFKIFFIRVGKMAKNRPSMNNNKPKAVIRSFMLIS